MPAHASIGYDGGGGVGYENILIQNCALVFLKIYFNIPLRGFRCDSIYRNESQIKHGCVCVGLNIFLERIILLLGALLCCKQEII